ncbi:MAG: hypothetical protein N4A31_02180 [Rickettsiales bacterium]|jgi:multidrug efflux pump subunit AcrB|nr:hypothetical protein [Rickettsiales bacterium]
MTTEAIITVSIPLIILNSEGSKAGHDIGIETLFTLLVLPNLYYLVKDIILKQN